MYSLPSLTSFVGTLVAKSSLSQFLELTFQHGTPFPSMFDLKRVLELLLLSGSGVKGNGMEVGQDQGKEEEGEAGLLGYGFFFSLLVLCPVSIYSHHLSHTPQFPCPPASSIPTSSSTLAWSAASCHSPASLYPSTPPTKAHLLFRSMCPNFPHE